MRRSDSGRTSDPLLPMSDGPTNKAERLQVAAAIAPTFRENNARLSTRRVAVTNETGEVVGYTTLAEVLKKTLERAKIELDVVDRLPEKLICEGCGSVYSTPTSGRGSGNSIRRRYCSLLCGEQHRALMKNPLVTKRCKSCSEEFSDTQNGRKEFCDKSCWASWRKNTGSLRKVAPCKMGCGREVKQRSDSSGVCRACTTKQRMQDPEERFKAIRHLHSSESRAKATSAIQASVADLTAEQKRKRVQKAIDARLKKVKR